MPDVTSFSQEFNPLTGDVQFNPANWGLTMRDVENAPLSLKTAIYSGNVNLTADFYKAMNDLADAKYAAIETDGSINTTRLPDTDMAGKDPGLYMDHQRVGFWNGTEWKTFLGNTGDFSFDGNLSNYIRWDGTTLVVRGTLQLGNGDPVESIISGLGDLAYLDVVEAAKLGDTVISGGYLKTELINAGAIAIGSLAGAGALAGQNSVDWSTQITSKPAFGALALKSVVDYASSDVTNKPALGSLAFQNLVSDAMLDDTLIVGGYIKTSMINAGAISIGSLSGAGSLASKNSVDWATADVVNKPSFGSLAFQDMVSDAMLDDTLIVGGYIKTSLINASAILIGSLSGAGTLATQNSVDWTTQVNSKPTLGTLAAQNTVDYATQVTAKPSLGALAALNSVNATYIEDGAITLTKLDAAAQTKVNNGDAAKASTDLWLYPSSTYIDGGKIFTGTVTANQINVANLFAQNISSTGQIYGAKATYASTTAGFWMGKDTTDADKYKFHIGNATQYLKWDGSALSIKGSITLENTIASTSVTGLGTLATQNSVAYGDLTGTKPPSNADVTLSAIQGSLSLAGGGLVLASGGASIRGGQTAYDTGTGFWIGDVTGTTKFSIGNSAGNKITWDGTALTIRGTLQVSDGTALGSLATKSSVGSGDVAFNYAGSTSQGGAANDTVLVAGSSATIVKQGALKADSALNSNNRYSQWLSAGEMAARTASTAAGVYFDSAGIVGYGASNLKTFEIKASDGTAFFRGDVYAVNGTFTGNISSSATISGGVIRSSSSDSGSRIRIDNTGIKAFYSSSTSDGNYLAMHFSQSLSGLNIPGILFKNDAQEDCGVLRAMDSLETLTGSDPGLATSKSLRVGQNLRVMGKMRIPVGINLY